MYTKSWSAFDRLVAIVPPGGSIGYVINHQTSKIILTFFFHLKARRQTLQLLAPPTRRIPLRPRQGHLPLRNRHQSKRIPRPPRQPALPRRKPSPLLPRQMVAAHLHRRPRLHPLQSQRQLHPAAAVILVLVLVAAPRRFEFVGSIRALAVQPRVVV
jgi:hypothetical protein